MNIFEATKRNAFSFDFPLDSKDVFNISVECELLGGLLIICVDGVVVDIRYSNDIISGLIASRKRFDRLGADELIYVIHGSESSLKFIKSVNMHVHQPKCCGIKRNGEINAPVAKKDMPPFFELLALKMELIIKDSFKYKKFNCVYFLLNDVEIQYVGKTTDIASRFSNHVKNGDIVFNRISIISCEDWSHCDLIESFYILKFKPPMQGRYKDGGIVARNYVDEIILYSDMSDSTKSNFLNEFHLCC